MRKTGGLLLILITLMMTESLAFGGVGWGRMDELRQYAVAIDSTMKGCFSIGEAECNRRLDRIAKNDGNGHTLLLESMVSIAQSNIVERDPHAARNYYDVVRRYAVHRFGSDSKEVEYVENKLATVQISKTLESDTASKYAPGEMYAPAEMYSGTDDDGTLVFSDDPTKVPKSTKQGQAKSSPMAGRPQRSITRSDIVGTWYTNHTDTDGRSSYTEMTFGEDGVETTFREETLRGGSKQRTVTTSRYIFRDRMLLLTSNEPPRDYIVYINGDSLAIRSKSGPPLFIVYKRKK